MWWHMSAGFHARKKNRERERGKKMKFKLKICTAICCNNTCQWPRQPKIDTSTHPRVVCVLVHDTFFSPGCMTSLLQVTQKKNHINRILNVRKNEKNIFFLLRPSKVFVMDDMMMMLVVVVCCLGNMRTEKRARNWIKYSMKMYNDGVCVCRQNMEPYKKRHT